MYFLPYNRLLLPTKSHLHADDHPALLQIRYVAVDALAQLLVRVHNQRQNRFAEGAAQLHITHRTCVGRQTAHLLQLVAVQRVVQQPLRCVGEGAEDDGISGPQLREVLRLYSLDQRLVLIEVPDAEDALPVPD